MEKLYKLILVDDEDEIRGRIASMITKDTGFEVVANASNGYDALELIERHSPHAVITDIRMPYIDGITLAQEIRNDFSKVKVAFLTGFGEFDYARKAVELEVISYLMKPVVKTDVLEFLKKLKSILDEEYNLINNMELLEENFNKNKQMFIEKQLNTFLTQSEIKDSDLEMMKLNGVDLSTGNYIVGIIEFYNSSIQEIFKSESFIREFINNAINQYEFIIPFSTSGGLGVIIKNDVLFAREVEFTISKLIGSKNEHDEVSVRVSLSSIFSDFIDFSSKFQEASAALSISRFTNAGNVISYDDIEETKTLQAIMTIENIKEIDYAIRFDSESDINDIFDRHIENAKVQSNLSVDYQLYIITTADILLRYALSLGIEVNQYFKGGLLSKLLPLTSIVEVLEFTRTEIIKLRKCSIDKGNSRINEIAKAAFLYIDMNFDDSTINLDKVSEHFNISVSYLSSLLKKEKNISFSKYLIQLRISKAKELLKYSDLKVIEVAEKVGYNDVYYFSHSFKKNTKMSPKEYRENG